MRKYLLPVTLLLVGFAMVMFGWVLYPHFIIQKLCPDNTSCDYYTQIFGFLIPDVGYFVMAAGGIWIGITRRTKKYVLPVGVLVMGFAMAVYGWTFDYVDHFCLRVCNNGDGVTPYLIAFAGYFIMAGAGIWLVLKRKDKVPPMPL